MKHATGLLLAVALLLSAAPLRAQSVFINEIHYDNDGGDVNEAIEIAGPAGTDLSGYSIVLYNGANGQTYSPTTALTGTIPNQQEGYGTLNFLIAPIQNGAPDGLALVDASNNVVQFLSYEGTFNATNGPANGMTSVDIGVSESGSEAVGLSLQLVGTGSTYSDFTWSGPVTSTPGAINTNQTFVAPAVTNARISVIVDSLVANCDGSYTAFFGYLSDNTAPVAIAAGADNRFSPAPADRGQTTEFLPGRHRSVFSVNWDGASNLVWTLRGPDGSSRTTTAGMGFPNITQEPGCASACDVLAMPSYTGGYVLNTDENRAFVRVEAPAGATTFEFYNLNNLVVGDPEGAANNTATPLSGFSRSGHTFTFEAGSEPNVAFFPIAPDNPANTRVHFFLKVSDTCGRTVDVDPVFSLAGIGQSRLSGFALGAAQPNPAATSATIRFSLEEASHVRLTLYDVLGREVMVLAGGMHAAGEQSVRVEASALPSGVYVYRLEAGARSLTHTLTIAR